MILCVNLNAAIDRTVVVNSFRLGEIHRPEQVIPTPGGKGCNVARGLKSLSESPVVTGWVGGFAGQFIEGGLQREGIGTSFVHTDFESRICTSILDSRTNILTEIYEKGDAVPADKVVEFKKHFHSIIADFAAVTFSGSLPPGVPKDFYGQVLEISRAANVPSFLDSSGEPFKLGLELGKPNLIKPNEKEFAELAGYEIKTLTEFKKAAVEISTRYQTIVVVSMGAEGAIAANQSQVFRVCPPQVTIKSAVGSGDCVLAGMVYGLTHSLSLEESLKFGVAAGTANALTVGAGVFSTQDFERMLADVTVVRA